MRDSSGGVSRSQGYRLLKKAWAQIKDDIDGSGIDRQELLSWSIQTLMAAAGQAMQQKNPCAVVACIRQLDHMTGTGYNSHRGHCLLYTSPSPRDRQKSRMPSSA